METLGDERAAATGRLRSLRGRPSDPLAASRRRVGFVFTLPVIGLVGSLLLLPIGQTIYHSFTSCSR